MSGELKQGDLVETITYKGNCVYGIVINSVKRFHYEEVRLLIESSVKAVVYDGNKNGIKLIQRVNHEARTTKQIIREVSKDF